MKNFLTGLLFLSAAQQLTADPISQDAIRQLALANDAHQLELEMDRAQAAFVSGETSADHLRQLQSVFFTTSPKIREVAEKWLQEYPESHHAIMANAWISHKIAWTIRGTRYASQTYRDVWPAYKEAAQRSADLTMRAYEIDPSYLPASDGMIVHSIDGNLALETEILVHTVMAKTPNAGTLTRGLRMAQSGWGGTYQEGERMCAVHAHKVSEWGEQAFDICMIHLAFHFTRWRPIDAFVNRLFNTDHPAVLDIRHQVMVSSTLLDPFPSETDFPFEKWQSALIERVNAEDFSDLKLALKFDNHFLNNADLPIVSDKVRHRARAYAKDVLVYDPYNLDALKTLLNNEGYKTLPDGGKQYQPLKDLNSKEEYLEIYKRLAIAQPWNPDHWSNLAHSYAGPPLSVDQFKTKRLLERNYLAYSNHSPKRLWEFIETNLYMIGSYDLAATGNQFGGLEWITSLDPLEAFYCPTARAKLLMDTHCPSATLQEDKYACMNADFQGDQLNEILGRARNGGACVLSSDDAPGTLEFQPVDFDLSVLN